MRLLRACAVLALLAAFARAQEPALRTVQVTVTAVSDRSVYLDHGRDVGLRPGMFVQLFPPGVAGLDVEIRSVSQSSARAELPPGLPPPQVGTRGEARVPVAAEPPAGAAPARAAPVAHPPWSRQEGQRAADQPLLVPTFRQHPDQRPATLDGRLFAFGQWNRDLGGDRDGDSLLGRLAVRADAHNQLGHAERLRFAGELDERVVQLPDAPDQRDRTARLDLLSVAIGTEAWAPAGFEAGRFFSSHLPEIGLVDGVELVRRYEGGLRLGAGVGAYPRPFPARDAGDDVGVHGFLDYSANLRRSFAAALGVQKTWHRGAPDRDLVLLRAEGRPGDGVWLHGSAKLDLYTGSDTVKGRGAELTEAYGAAHWDAAAAGAGLTLSHFAWPELQRAEYQALPDELVRDGAVDRGSLHGWTRPCDGLRLAARTDHWRDQDRAGTSYGLDADLQDVIGEGSALAVSLFASDGGYTSGPGARVALRGPLGGGAWRAGWRWHRYEFAGLVTGTETFTRQSVEVGFGVPVGSSGDLDVSFERWFGDREDAFALALYLQWRF